MATNFKRDQQRIHGSVPNTIFMHENINEYTIDIPVQDRTSGRIGLSGHWRSWSLKSLQRTGCRGLDPVGKKEREGGQFLEEDQQYERETYRERERVVNNLWACVAVLTAALSFWRIEATTVTATSVSRSSSPPSPQQLPSPREDPIPIGIPRTLSSPVAHHKRSPSRKADVSEQPFVTTKRRFAAYYDVDDRREEDCDETEEPPVVATAAGTVSEVIRAGNYNIGTALDWWEMALKVRNGDSAPYRYQDRAVLDGSVVRLWKDTRPVGPLGL
ncbi:hypothetical protein SAY87_023216 [Trapa incisa]|uniref:Uncharacterized protein n=1 Tax=Trapa incisa TaxID=236973 RepID=A0AAN7QAM4_9MYRT|nr:hypothetical protein SAY87_023216 [Trapa incisa]